MRKIPFNVSARTARLIGRENVSSAEGAIIELVKNSYDADAKNCIVYFEDKFSELPQTLEQNDYKEFETLLTKLNIHKAIDSYSLESTTNSYIFSNEKHKENFTTEERSTIDKKLLENINIYIIDDGEGMSEEVIERAWMTIGTDNKNEDFISNTGRVKSGAKGIGRFALDRLGGNCELLTKNITLENSLLWKVNWGDFDKQGITINGVNAELGNSIASIENNFQELITKNTEFEKKIDTKSKGTHIKVSNVRDQWRAQNIQKIFSELESLVPPVEAGGFDVFVYSQRQKSEFGQVLPSICDDYDYKLSASMDQDGIITFDAIRKEIDTERLKDEVLARPFFKNPMYTRESLLGHPLKYSKSLYELIPGLKEHNSSAHKLIGKFNFTLYFLKRTSDQKSTEMFFHRTYNSDARKRWLEHNNGIRIYRDNFRVRPYGEIGKASWDWLGLGRRQAEDPSALRSGRWKVTPNNISGVINISRINNLGLEDKSSREGIQENESFGLFKSIIEALVKEFEKDRSALYREFYLYSLEKKRVPTDEELDPKQEEDAEKLAQKIFENIKKEHNETQDDSTKLALALLKEKARTREIDDRLEDMKKENSLLRVFASSGITIASFTHELDSLNARLGNRFDQLATLILAYSDMDKNARLTIQDFKNPFKRIEMLKRDDERVKNWIKYSLRTIRKDKRKRVKINIKTYLENLRDEWTSTLEDRQVFLDVQVNDKALSLRAYEIDLDCIFNNLIINSADAFKRPGFSGRRNISIKAESKNEKIYFSYNDTGPGLSKDILDPQDIFRPTFTTKTNNLGEETGTGLGMWLIEKTVEEYGGRATLGQEDGFALFMELKG
ncbi:ATP-binding protein [Pseudomonas sp. 8(2025)]|uniref:ATP-binding protein n=1 Tax=Pseudomonas sp. 8(2025) TaxID=3456022 RepID=UPI004043F261